MKPYMKLNTKLRTAAKNEFEKDIIESQLNYSLPVWAQNANSIKRLLVLQNKSLRILHFFKRSVHTSNIFKNFNILKLHDKVSLEIASLFVNILINLSQKVLKSGLLLQQLHIHIIPDGLTQVALKYLLTKRKYMVDHQRPLTKFKSSIKKLYTSNYN